MPSTLTPQPPLQRAAATTAAAVVVAALALITNRADGAPMANFDMPLVLLTQEQAGDGVCLDGSVPGFYYKAASDPALATTWVLYFKGGGWSYNEESSAERSTTELGSSTKFPKQFGFPEGPVSGDPSVNPDLAKANRVILWYCDGCSFSGARAEPRVVPYGGKNVTLYFRGFSVLNAILDTLLDDAAPYGLSKATDVLLSGGSAGGLSTFLHADTVGQILRDRAPGLKRYKAAPGSGFFLRHDDLVGNPVYPGNMSYAFHMQNSTGGVNQACISAYEQKDQWQCIMAQYSYAHTKTPMFLLQSVTDAWQMGNILDDHGVGGAAWHTCLADNFAKCEASQVGTLNGYASSMMAALQGADKFASPGNGAFLETCLEHCAHQGAGWSKYEINNTTMQGAFSSWWHASTSDPASRHTYMPCTLAAAAPHECNPTC